MRKFIFLTALTGMGLVWYFTQERQSESVAVTALEDSGVIYEPLTFNQLRGIDPKHDGPFGMPVEGVPESIREIDGSTIMLEGFADPLIVERDVVSTFRMLRTLGSCCFGVPHLANEVVLVELRDPEEAIEIRIGEYVRVHGTLHVVADVEDPRRGTLLYKLVADRVNVISSF